MSVSVPSQQQGAVPFRQATIERAQLQPSTSSTMTTATQVVDAELKGSGYLYSVVLKVTASGATAGTATVAAAEDAPYSVLDTVTLNDVNGQLVNVNGYNLYLANLINAQYRTVDPSGGNSAYASAGLDDNIFSAVDTDGNFKFFLRIPVGTNRRDLVGILGNQDRGQSYFIRSDIAGSGSVYSTAPEGGLPTVAIARYYENYAVPMAQSANGQSQQQYPDSFGILHYLTSTTSSEAPAGGSTVNHYLKRVGNTVRWIALVFRSDGSRATAETNAPTQITMKLGEEAIFTEDYSYRRLLMWERFGFSFPKGVLVYDALHDFWPGAGDELGNDYYHTQALVNAQFIIAYPSGFGSTDNSLTIITDDLQQVS